jgi:hypothetical protein
MRINKRLLGFSVITAVFCLCILAAVYWLATERAAGSTPPDVEGSEPTNVIEPIVPLPSVLPTGLPAFTPQPQAAINESRRLTLEFPSTMRAGDSDIVRLTLEVDDLGNITPTAQFEGNVLAGEVIQMPNLYESHHVIAESRFDIASVEIRPTDLINVPLAQGQTATFLWSIRPPDVGIYHGTIWLYLRFVDKLNGEESRLTVSAQIVEIEAVNLIGLSGSLARTTGFIGSIIGTVIGFPFLEDIVKFLYNKRRRK